MVPLLNTHSHFLFTPHVQTVNVLPGGARTTWTCRTTWTTSQSPFTHCVQFRLPPNENWIFPFRVRVVARDFQEKLESQDTWSDCSPPPPPSFLRSFILNLQMIFWFSGRTRSAGTRRTFRKTWAGCESFKLPKLTSFSQMLEIILEDIFIACYN